MCVALSWDGGTTWTTAQTTATLTTGEATYLLGSAADNWGRTWATGEFSNANFRVRITNVAGSTARDFSLDWAAVQVYYTPSAAFPSTGILDNFNRADGALGSNWAGPIWPGDTADQISDQRMAPPDSWWGDDSWSAQQFGADQEVYFTWVHLWN